MSTLTRRITSTFAALALAALVAVPAQAQSKSGTIAATADVEFALTVAGVQDLAFGTHFPSDGVVEQSQTGQFNISLTGGATVDLSFSQLPTELVNGGATPLPVTFQSASARAFCNNTDNWFDPAVGFTGCQDADGDGAIAVHVGHGISADNAAVTVDFSQADAPGTYSGTIELTAVVQ